MLEQAELQILALEMRFLIQSFVEFLNQVKVVYLVQFARAGGIASLVLTVMSGALNFVVNTVVIQHCVCYEI